MKLCLLCQKNEADKTGSHIVPHFLIQTMINSEGKKGRDRELAIEIGKLSTGFFIGNSVLPEKIDSVLGRELTEDEIENQSHPFVMDFIFCTRCENRFSEIESEYSRLSKVDKKNTDSLYSNKVPVEIGICFWASVIWRISVSKIAGFSLGNEEEKIRYILDETLTDKTDDLVDSINKVIDMLSTLGYSLIYSPDTDSPTSMLFMAHPYLNHPCCIIINKHVLIFQSNGEFRKLEQDSFFGFEQFHDTNSFNCMGNKAEIFTLLTKEEYFKCIQNVFKYKMKLFFDELVNYCKYMWLKIVRSTIPQELLEKIMNRIITEQKEQPSLQKYSMDTIRVIIAEEIQIHLKSKSSN